MSRIRFCPLHNTVLTPLGWCVRCGTQAPRVLDISKLEKELRAEIPSQPTLAAAADEIARGQVI